MNYAIAEPDGDPGDFCDQATAASDLALTVALRQRQAEASQFEDQAIDADGVVRCLECGDPIDHARLAALAPLTADGKARDLSRSTATRHVECQRDHEQRQRRHAHG